jgi:LuxR family maltose regulon positive regulatory protein
MGDSAIFVISRTEPAVNTIPLLSKGWFSGLTADDLRFSEEEISGCFALRGISLSPENLARVCRDTEGWALAVDLLTRDIKSVGAENYNWRQIGASSWRKIESRIFSSIDGGLRKFFIKLSLLDHWSRELLEILDPKGVYVTAMEMYSALSRYDSYLHGYRLHHLFLEFLRGKKDELSEEEIREVYLQGAVWCMRNKLYTDAAVYYEKAKHYQGIVKVLETFSHFLPRSIASFFLELVNRIYPPIGENPDFTFLWFVYRPRFLLFLNRFDEAFVECRKTIEFFQTRTLTPLNAKILASSYTTLGTLALVTCRFTRDYTFLPYFEKAYHYYSIYKEPIQGLGISYTRSAYTMQLGYPAEKGECERLIEAFVPIIRFAAHTGNENLYGIDTLARAEMTYYRGDMDNAEQYIKKAIFKAREKNLYALENHGLFLLLRMTLHTRGPAEAEEIIRQLDAQLDNESFSHRYICYDIVTGWYWLQLEVPKRLAPWLKNDVEENELDTVLLSKDLLIKAKYAYREKQYENAINILKRGECTLGTYLLGKIEMTLLEMAAAYHQGRKEEALNMLEAAYDAASPNDIDMPFIEMGEDMRLIAGDYLAGKRRESGKLPVPWLESIRNKASAYGKKLTQFTLFYERESNGAQIYLSSRERVILDGLSRGQSREEIAGMTGLTLNVVKSAIRTINSKLGAVNRVDAIRIATHIGLLSPGKDNPPQRRGPGLLKPRTVKES